MAKKKGKKPADDARHYLTVKQLLAKARALTTDVEPSEALQAIDGEESMWNSMQAVLAPYDPQSLLKYIELTPHVLPCISAMTQNVDGYGHRSAPKESWMDSKDDKEVLEEIIAALKVERWVTVEENALAEEDERQELEEKIENLREKKATARTIRKYQRRLDDLLKVDDEPEPEDDLTDDERLMETAQKLLAEMREKLSRERYVFKSWFEHCCSDMSFIELRKAVRQDIESHGWGTIEWLRDKYGRLKRLQYLPAYTVRPLQDKGEFVNVAEDDSVTPFSQDREVIVARRFRIYVQQVGGSKVYFKSPADPRVISRTTGNVYSTVKALQAPTDAKKPGEGKDAQPANELMWISRHDPTTPCPPPVWVGNLLAVLGIREADETNYYYLGANAIPSGLLFVHGGVVPKATKERLENRIQHEVQGPEGAGKILVIEANPGSRSAPGEKTMLPSITFQSLREAHTTDALFSNYDVRSADRIGASFRLSPLLRGYTPSDLNRATAVAALYFAEQQVFLPLREAFDWMINKMIIPEIGLQYLMFKSNSPPTTSTQELGEFIQAVAPHGAFIPDELRKITSDAMNIELAKLDATWTEQPIQLTLAGINGSTGEANTGEGGPDEVNARLRSIETKLAQVLTEDLRAAGLDYDVTATFIDEEDADDSDGYGAGK